MVDLFAGVKEIRSPEGELLFTIKEVQGVRVWFVTRKPDPKHAKFVKLSQKMVDEIDEIILVKCYNPDCGKSFLIVDFCGDPDVFCPYCKAWSNHYWKFDPKAKIFKESEE